MLTYTGPVLNNDVMKDDLTVTVTDVWMNLIHGDMITNMRTSLLIVTQNNNDIVYGLNAISLWIKSDTNRNILQIKHFIHSILWNTGYFGSYIKTTAACSRLIHGLKAICSDFTQIRLFWEHRIIDRSEFGLGELSHENSSLWCAF